tara:strand:- start:7350 stop:8732 length:1383 start_codon:yes stop_codon:yes gene_type:complete
MPFKSKEQERYLQINEPEIYRDWVEKYGRFKGAESFGAEGGYSHQVFNTTSKAHAEKVASLVPDSIVIVNLHGIPDDSSHYFVMSKTSYDEARPYFMGWLRENDYFRTNQFLSEVVANIRKGMVGDTAYQWYVDGDESIQDRNGEPLIRPYDEEEIDEDIRRNIKIVLERGENKGNGYHGVDDFHDRFDEPQSYGIFYSWGAESFSSEMSHSDKSLILWEMVQQNLNYPPAVEGFYATFFGVDKEYYDGMDLVVLEAVKDFSKNPEWTDEMFKEYGLDNCYGCGDDSKTTKYLPFDEGDYDYWCKECYEDMEGEKWDAESFGAEDTPRCYCQSEKGRKMVLIGTEIEDDEYGEMYRGYSVREEEWKCPSCKKSKWIGPLFFAESFNSYKVAPDLSSYTKAELVSSIAGPQGTAAYDEVVYDPIAQSRLSAESIDSFSPARLMILGASIGVALGLYNTRGE